MFLESISSDEDHASGGEQHSERDEYLSVLLKTTEGEAVATVSEKWKIPDEKLTMWYPTHLKGVKLVNAIKKHASPDHNKWENSSIFLRGSLVIIVCHSYCMLRVIVIICLEGAAAKFSNSFMLFY